MVLQLCELSSQVCHLVRLIHGRVAFGLWKREIKIKTFFQYQNYHCPTYITKPRFWYQNATGRNRLVRLQDNDNLYAKKKSLLSTQEKYQTQTQPDQVNGSPFGPLHLPKSRHPLSCRLGHITHDTNSKVPFTCV